MATHALKKDSVTQKVITFSQGHSLVGKCILNIDIMLTIMVRMVWEGQLAERYL